MEIVIDGETVRISRADWPKLRKYKWRIGSMGYAVTSINSHDVAMHEILLGKAPEGLVTDHKDRNKLNNSRRNLRHTTRAKNFMNSDWYESGQHSIMAREHVTSQWAAIKAHGLKSLKDLDLTDWKNQASA